MSTPERQMTTEDSGIEGESAQPGLYRLDYETCEAELHAGKKSLSHVFRRPTFDDLHARAQKIINEEINQSASETEPIYDDAAANVWLYDRLIKRVRGYRTGTEDANGWSDVGPELLPLIPVAHKQKAISGIYQMTAEFIEDDDTLFAIVGAMEFCIETTIVDQFKVRHYLQQPTEAQWAALQRKQVQTRQVRGAQKQHYKYSVNLAAARDFYDACLVRIEGACLGAGLGFTPAMRAEFVSAVDAVMKQLVVQRFSDYYAAKLRE